MMSGKFLARASALSLAFMLVACGGDDGSTPIVNVNTDKNNPSTDGEGTSTETDGSDSSAGGNDNSDGSGTGEPNNSVLNVGSFNSSGDFQKGTIRVETPTLIVGPNSPASTPLRLSILNENNELDEGIGHTVEFSSPCIDANKATVESSGTAQSGTILADYIASGECNEISDKLSATIDGNNDYKATAQITTSRYNLALGSYDQGTGKFSKGIMSVTNDTLDYATSEIPTTEFVASIGQFDSENNFQGLFTGSKVALEFFSSCADSDLSAIDSTGSTESGKLVSTYSAKGCVGEDTIFGRIAGTSDLISSVVSIEPKKGLKLSLGHFNSSGTFNDEEIGNKGLATLLPGVQTKLYLSIVDSETNLQVKGQPLTVEFVSSCGEQPGATSPLSTNTSTVSLGYTELLYTAGGCSHEEDTVTATLTGVEGISATAEVKITLDQAPANSLTAKLPKPNSIAPAWYSTDGRETTSELEVQLKDNDGNGLRGETITFSLDNPGNTDVADLSPVNNGVTDDKGFATVKIKAIKGYDNVVFRVIANYTDSNGNDLEAYSAPIAVNSKLPFSERFSISTSNFAPDTQGKDGVQVQLTLLAADDEGNRIRGNTVVNFETYLGLSNDKAHAGSIDPECVLDNEGRCSITWESLGISSTTEAEKLATVVAYTHGRLPDGSTGRIESSVPMLMSTSSNIRVELDSNAIPAAGGPFCAEAWVDILGNAGKNSPPVGTTLEFEVLNGSLNPASSSSYTLGSSSALVQTPYSFTACTFVEPAEDPDPTKPMKLTVTATPPNSGTPATDRAFQ